MKIASRCVCCGGADLARRPAVLMPFVAFRAFGWEPAAVTPDWGLRDLAPGHAHSVCATLQCRACGLLFLDMRLDGDEMAALYADYRGEAYRAARERFEPGYSARNAILNAGSTYIPAVEAFLQPHLGPAPRVLDWGGDTGLNTPFRGRAALHHVLDISDKPVVPGAARVAGTELIPGAYDLVVSAQVLEHVSEPAALVAEMGAVLGPDALLYLEMPHEDGVRLEPDPARRLDAKRHWHEHVNFFTEAALDAMLARAGLESVARLSHPISAGGKESHVFSLIARRAGSVQQIASAGQVASARQAASAGQAAAALDEAAG